MFTEERVRWAKFRVIMMSLAAIAILATLLFLLLGTSLFRPKAIVYAYLPDATGLAPGSPVRVDGIDIGKIKSISLTGFSDPDRTILVEMVVDALQLRSVPDDSTAQAAADTLVGDKFIQITSGHSPGRIQPGAFIRYKGSPDLVKSIDLPQFRKNLVEMDQVLTDIEQGRSPLGQFVIGDQMYRDVSRRMRDLDRAIRAAANTSSSVGHELYTDALYTRLRKPIEALDRTLAMIQSGQGPAGRLLRDSAQYEQMRAQAEGMRQSIAALHEMEMLKSPAMYDTLDRTIVGWIQKVNEFNATPLMTSSATYEYLTGAMQELRRGVHDFRVDPRKYLRTRMF